jgi:glycosyltransferase involved in cell wall biosynthesis
MIVTNSLSGGGAERSMNLVSNELFSRGWKVALVPINIGPSDQVVPLCEVFPLSREWQGGAAHTLSSLLRLNKIVRSWKPDLVIIGCDLPEFFGSLLFGNWSLIAVAHTNHPWIGREKFGKIIRSVLAIRGVTWVAVSSHISIWPKNEKPRTVLVNSIIQPHLSFQEFSGGKLKRLVFVGRLSPEKRPSIALDVAAQSLRPIVLIGDGELREALVHQANQIAINCEFVGQVLDPWSKTLSGDLLIVPSAHEGDGLVVLEALQNAIPILLADIPDFRRFGFPERNYCKGIPEYLSAIEEYEDHLGGLLIPEEISRPLLDTRSISNVGDAWERFLSVQEFNY